MNKKKNLLIINIKSLIQVDENPHLKRGEELARMECVDNAYLYAENGIIINYGKMQEMPLDYATILNTKYNNDPHSFEEIEIIDAKGKYVLPTFCDSHTHIVYAGSREQEFVDKINGLTYQEIAARGGGILNSAKLLHNSSEEDLYNSAMKRVQEVIATGTGAIEIKSGYGLNHNDELKILRVIRRIKESTPICVKSTYLGAHAYPEKYRNNHNGYINEIINETIPAIGRAKTCRFY
jgi:Imidazolonepropionase and related amidohydrolases